MKVARSVTGLCLLFLLLFSIETNFSSCQKQIITDTLRIRDTIRITDTVHVTDSSTCNCYDLKDGLVAYYNFNGGNLNDSSGYNNNITFNNATKTADRYGRANNAYLFDGTDNAYMKVANSASLNPTSSITLMATFKINGFNASTCPNNQVFGKGWNDYINGFYSMRFFSLPGCNVAVDTAKEAFNSNYGDLNTRNSIVLNDNANNYAHSNIWYTVVYTYGNGQSNLYVNGVLKSTINQTAAFTPNTQELYIGKHGDPQYPYNFKGVIDEIRIYNKALCANAVKQLTNLKD
ncbi:MAG: LamG domain-containing protein [Chitinophagaceae bacterium]